MKRYYFDDENKDTLSYSTYWYGEININENIKYDKLVYIKDIFKIEYNIELEWIVIDFNQIKLTIHRNIKYYYYQFQKDILGLIKKIQKKCKIKIENANFEAWESRPNSDCYRYLIRKIDNVFKLTKKKFNIEKWNIIKTNNHLMELDNQLQELELNDNYLTIIGNIYIHKQNKIHYSDIKKINEYVLKENGIVFKILLGIDVINIYMSEKRDMKSTDFEKMMHQFFIYLESEYNVFIDSCYCKLLSKEIYKYRINKKESSFHFHKIKSNNILFNFSTIWKGYFNVSKEKKDWISKEKIKEIDKLFAEKYDINFYIYYDEDNIFFSICPDSYYYVDQFDENILKMVIDIENILSVQIIKGCFEAWECRFNADFYKYNFSMNNKKLKFDKSCININNYESSKKQKIK